MTDLFKSRQLWTIIVTFVLEALGLAAKQYITDPFASQMVTLAMTFVGTVATLVVAKLTIDDTIKFLRVNGFLNRK